MATTGRALQAESLDAVVWLVFRQDGLDLPESRLFNHNQQILANNYYKSSLKLLSRLNFIIFLFRHLWGYFLQMNFIERQLISLVLYLHSLEI